jgi:hypothetical protein
LGGLVSFPALALAAAAVAEVTRYTGVKTSFIESLDVHVSHYDGGQPVWTVSATAYAFGYLETQPDGWPLGIHDPARPRDEVDRLRAEAGS